MVDEQKSIENIIEKLKNMLFILVNLDVSKKIVPKYRAQSKRHWKRSVFSFIVGYCMSF